MMEEEIAFLCQAAEQLRDLARLAPEIAGQLIELAAELDREADRLETGKA